MTPPFDEHEQRRAARIERDHPRWLILWALTHLLGLPQVPRPISSHRHRAGHRQLTTRMQHAGLTAYAHMPRPPQTPRTTSHPTQGNDNA
jgi:hypothetical protein